MPLRDHFHEPLTDQLDWSTVHAGWSTRIADDLNDRWLPQEFLAAEVTRRNGQLEIDIATYQRTSIGPLPRPQGNGTTATTAEAEIWSPPLPASTVDGVLPDEFEVQIFSTVGGRHLVGAIELISPANKDRPSERHAFATKCAALLGHGVCVVVVDVVTHRRANLHHAIMRLIDAPEPVDLPASMHLYAVTYRPVLRDDRPQIDIWTAPLALGQPLPTMPLRLTGDLFVPIEFESTYEETCRRRRLT